MYGTPFWPKVEFILITSGREFITRSRDFITSDRDFRDEWSRFSC